MNLGKQLEVHFGVSRNELSADPKGSCNSIGKILLRNREVVLSANRKNNAGVAAGKAAAASRNTGCGN